MSTPVLGVFFALAVIVAIYFLFVLPGERRYHETKLRLVQEEIERRQKARSERQSQADDGDDRPDPT